MKITKDDPRLMDYVLNELETEEHAAIEAALKLEENAEARAEVATLRQVVDLSVEALSTEETAVELDAEQRAEVFKEAAQGEAPAKKPFFLFRPAFALAACALLGVGLVLNGYIVPTKSERMELADRQETLRARIERLPEGVERFLITDINNPAGSAQASPRRFLSEIESGKDLDGIEKEMDTIEEELINAGMGEQYGLLEKNSADIPAEVEAQMEALGYLGDTTSGSAGTQAEPMASSIPAPIMLKQEAKKFEEWDDLEVGSISGQQAVAADRLQRAAELAKPAPVAVAAPPAQPLLQRSVPVVKAEEESLPEITTEQLFFNSSVGAGIGAGGFGGGGGRAGGRAGGALANRTRPDIATDGLPSPELVDELEALGYLGDSQPSRDYYFAYPRQSGEAYLPIEEKAFASVLQKPLSTFSIDVDTGAYSNVRRFIEQGRLPDPNAVRIEELINYFDYVPNTPVGDVPFGVGVEVAPCPWQPEHWLSKVVVSGKEVDAEERGDANLVFLLDVSGSMSDANKLPLVKESMKALLKELRPSDRVALVTYAGSSQVVLKSTAVGEGKRIRNAIEGLHAGGGTNGSGGIEAAYRIAKAHYVDGGINRVILATDGDFNIGVTHHGGLMGLITEHAKSNVFLTALGFGMGNYKDATLEQLADKGNGNYAYIDGIAEARKVLVDELSGTMITIAKDVKIQVEFNPQHIGHYRLIGYENRALKDRDFNDDTKDAGEIGAGHQVTALYELVPAGQSPQPGVDALKYQATESDARPERELSDELMNVKLRYKDPEGSVSAKIEVPVKRDAVTRNASADFKFVSAVAGYGLVVRNSQYRGNANLDAVVAWAEAGKQPYNGFAGGGNPRKMMEEVDDMEDARQDFIDLVVTTKTLLQR